MDLKNLINIQSLPQQERDKALIYIRRREREQLMNQQVLGASTSQPATNTSYGSTVNPFGRLPIEGPISQGYGVPVSYEKSGRHGGIDIAAPTGTPVPSVEDGIVIEAGPNGNWGNTIVVQRADGSKARYSHLSKINVKSGQEVQDNQIIGLVGSTGLSTGPHLDWRIYK